MSGILLSKFRKVFKGKHPIAPLVKAAITAHLLKKVLGLPEFG